MATEEETTQEKTEIVTEVNQKSTKKGALLIKISLALISTFLVAGGVYYFFVTYNTKPTTKTLSTSNIERLRVGTYYESIDMNYPGKSEIGTVGEVEVASQIFEGLVQYKDLTKIKPLLATNWTNPDSSTWVFELKKGVKFHTGNTMTATDVKYSIEALQAAKNYASEQYVSSIKSVNILDTNKIEIITNGPDPLLLNKLAYVYIVDSKSPKADDPNNGTGPFKVKDGSKPSESSLELTAFSDYHAGKSRVKALSFTSYQTYEELLTVVKKKEVDIGGDLNDEDLSQFKKAGFRTLSDDGAATSSLVPRVAKGGPIAKTEVRQALDHLIDKGEFFKKTRYSGKAATQLIPDQIPGYNPSIKPRTVDVEKAKQLLAKAGYPDGVSLVLYYSNGIPERVIEYLVSSAAKGNITIIPEEFPNPEDISADIESNKADLIMQGWSSSVVDGIDFFTQATIIPTGTTDKTLLDIVNSAGTEFEPAKRLKDLQDASKKVFDEALMIPLYHRYSIQVITKPSYVFTQEISGTPRGIYYWQTYKKE